MNPADPCSPVSTRGSTCKSFGALACEATVMIGGRAMQASTIVGEWALEASATVGQRALEASAAVGQRALETIKNSSKDASKTAAQVLATSARSLDSAMNSYLDELRESLHQRMLTVSGAISEVGEDSDSDASSEDEPQAAACGAPVLAASAAPPSSLALQQPGHSFSTSAAGGRELRPHYQRATSSLVHCASHQLERDAALSLFARSASFPNHSSHHPVQGAHKPLAAHRVQEAPSALPVSSARPVGRQEMLSAGSFGPLAQTQPLPNSPGFDQPGGQPSVVRACSMGSHPGQFGVQPLRFPNSERHLGTLAQCGSFGHAVRPGLPPRLAR